MLAGVSTGVSVEVLAVSRRSLCVEAHFSAGFGGAALLLKSHHMPPSPLLKPSLNLFVPAIA